MRAHTWICMDIFIAATARHTRRFVIVIACSYSIKHTHSVPYGAVKLFYERFHKVSSEIDRDGNRNVRSWKKTHLAARRCCVSVPDNLHGRHLLMEMLNLSLATIRTDNATLTTAHASLCTHAARYPCVCFKYIHTHGEAWPVPCKATHACRHSIVCA